MLNGFHGLWTETGFPEMKKLIVDFRDWLWRELFDLSNQGKIRIVSSDREIRIVSSDRK